jgi:hypothetical protein
MASSCAIAPPALFDANLSVSFILGTAANQYAAAALSNVRYHFRSYVSRCLGVVLRSVVARRQGVHQFDDLPPAERKRWSREMGKAYDDVLYHRHGAEMTSNILFRPTIARHRNALVPPLPPGTTSIDSDLSTRLRPYIYLGYMLRMTSFLEATGAKKLPSPLPLKTSFIPAHYGIDTSSIAHLLMDHRRMRKFKNFFQHSIAGGFPLPGLTNKATLISSLATMSGRAAVTPNEEELYKDALWTYLARFKNRRTKILNPLLHARARDPGAMRFDHSISTDGYSVTMVASDREVRGRKHQFKCAVSAKKFKAKSKTADEFPNLKADSAYDIRPTARMTSDRRARGCAALYGGPAAA